VRQWGDFTCAEGEMPPPVAGATCPPEMANVDDRFCIDRWEGSLVERTAGKRDMPWPPFGAVEEGHTLVAVSARNVYPQAYISGAQAERACAAAGKRLCAPVEWRKACMGPDKQVFGYGNARVTGRCNDQGHSPMLRLYPQVASSWTLVGMTEMNDPRLNQLDSTLAPTGSYSGCTNGYGVYDMVGNLHEWTSDPHGTFQGGYYLDTHINGDGCSYRTVAHEFTYHDYSTGFRCCADPATSR
jgi:formylglycine-generating enzyme required for sulfatase activity